MESSNAFDYLETADYRLNSKYWLPLKVKQMAGYVYCLVVWSQTMSIGYSIAKINIMQHFQNSKLWSLNLTSNCEEWASLVQAH